VGAHAPTHNHFFGIFLELCAVILVTSNKNETGEEPVSTLFLQR
jgi:hypothetical protein